jgi:hypothetical protein
VLISAVLNLKLIGIKMELSSLRDKKIPTINAEGIVISIGSAIDRSLKTVKRENILVFSVKRLILGFNFLLTRSPFRDTLYRPPNFSIFKL